MNFDDFIDLYFGRPCVWDPSLGTQCMALMHFYVYICLEIHDESVLRAPNAKSTWKLDYPQYFKKVKNTIDAIPVKGDIIVWDGIDGHIAVVVDAVKESFNSFDANYPTGSYPHIQHHNYNNVLGWFHPIVVPEVQKLSSDLIACQKDVSTLPDIKKQLDAKIRDYNALKKSDSALQDKYDTLLKTIQDNKPSLKAFETKEVFDELLARIFGR